MDSISLRFWINKWARKQLFLERAKQNLDQKTKEKFKKMVKEYHRNLLINSYKDLITDRLIDSTVTKNEIIEFCLQRDINLKLKKEYVKFRYVKIPLKFPSLDKIKKKFKRFNTTDQVFLKQHRRKFRGLYLNDSTWHNLSILKKKIEPIKTENKTLFSPIKKGFFQLKDARSVLFIQIKMIYKNNHENPLFMKPKEVHNLILKKRRVKAKQQLENEILKYGIENGEFKIFK